MFSVKAKITFIQKWMYIICGFRTLKYNCKFEKSNSKDRYYAIFLILVYVVNEFIRIPTEMKDMTKTIAFKTTQLLYGVSTSVSSVVTVLSESFILIKQKEKTYNNYVCIHNTIYKRAFTESSISGKSMTVFTFLLFYILSTVLCLGSNPLQLAALTFINQRSLTKALGIIEISSNIRICKDYISSVNDSLLLNFTKWSPNRKDLDFSPTTLHLRTSDAEKLIVKEEKHKDMNNYIKIFEMTNDTMKLISKRYTLMVKI